MREPKRLRDQDSDRVARLLLDAGHFDDPPKKRLDRIVAGVVGAGAAAGAKTAIASSALAAAPLAAKAATPLAAALKWLGVGMLAGLVVSGGAASLQTDRNPTKSDHGASAQQVARHDPEGTRGSRHSLELAQEPGVEHGVTAPGTAEPEALRRSSSRQPASRAAQGSLERVATPSSHRAAATEPAAEAVAESPEVETREKSTGTIEAGPSHALREELAALAFAKSALNQGSAKVALGAVRNYRKRFPSGALGREATYIEMEAEHALGHRSRAVVLAAEIAPGVTPNAERAREILKGE